MSALPTISIAMATYNGEVFLRKQLDSIFNQSLKPTEVIVCDDNSTDKTAQILEEYKIRYGLQYHINSERLGYIKNFEKAMSLCNGDYIALSDQDDIWTPNKLEVLVSLIENHSLISSDASLINAEDEIIQPSFAKYSKLKINLNEDVLHYIFNPFVTGCTTLFKRGLFLKSCPLPAHIPHDFWLALNAKQTEGLVYTSEKLIMYRQHTSNTLGATKKNKDVKWEHLSNKQNQAKRLESLSRKIQIFDSIIKNLSLTANQHCILQTKIDYWQSHINKSFSIIKLTKSLKTEKYSFKNISTTLKETFTYCFDTLISK